MLGVAKTLEEAESGSLAAGRAVVGGLAGEADGDCGRADLARGCRRKLHQRSFVEPGRVAADPGHGTAVAALLVGAPDPRIPPRGAAFLPDADLYAAGIFARQSSGQSEADALAIAEALDWMVQKHVRVVNVSLAGDNSALMALAVRRASSQGTILIAAAGNAGPNAPPAYPGALPEVIAVTAVDQQGAVFAEANRGSYIAFAAPGVRIWVPATDGQGRYETGTSFAAPFALGTPRWR
jgi:subtilisin family serine protease